MSGHNIAHELTRAPFEVLDPGSGEAIVVDRYNVTIPLTIGAGAETNTLAAPTNANQRVRIISSVQGAGSRAITAASSINQTGNTVMTFAAVEDVIVLESFPVGSAYKWRVVANDGVALS